MPYQFTDEDRVSTESMKWNTIGDNVQGTLIKKKQIEIFQNGVNKIVHVYDILQEDGKVKSVWGKEVSKNSKFDSEMQNIPLGKIFEIRYVGDGEAKPGMNAPKILYTYTHKGLFNKEWLEEQEQNNILQGNTDTPTQATNQAPLATNTAPAVKEDDGEIQVEEVPFNDKPEPVKGTLSYQKQEVEKLAKEKLNLKEGDDIQKAVMEATGIAYINNNLTKILEALKTM